MEYFSSTFWKSVWKPIFSFAYTVPKYYKGVLKFKNGYGVKIIAQAEHEYIYPITISYVCDKSYVATLIKKTKWGWRVADHKKTELKTEEDLIRYLNSIKVMDKV